MISWADWIVPVLACGGTWVCGFWVCRVWYGKSKNVAAIAKDFAKRTKKVTSVGEIVQEYLRANGYDGLAGENCGCGVDDLFACGENCLDCNPAYHILSNCVNCDTKCCAEGNVEACYMAEPPPDSVRVNTLKRG